MSRAFVNEESVVEETPERPVSPHPNYVTIAGLSAIDSALEAAQHAHAKAQASADRDALARASRDVRYWSARRSTAKVIIPANEAGVVQFGHAVRFVRDDGREQTFKIVGEDEADPAKGLVSHVSPIAKALLGRRKGDVVRAGASEIKILDIR
jgi:transcription elongation GreA/GreB family factor